MKIWMLAVIVGIVGMLALASFAVVNAVQNSDTASESSESASCSGSCGNSCTAESNCGLASCGAVKGTGSCGCS